MTNSIPPTRAPHLDVRVFVPALVLVIMAGGYLTLAPEAASRDVARAMNFITSSFGWLFVFTGFSALIFALWLAFGRYGQIKLGAPDDDPEYSEFAWAAMMFSAGIGIGLVSWAFVEPIYYLGGPPLGVTPNSSAAAEWGHMYGQFHWGIVPWAIYAIPAVPVAYSLYVRGDPWLRMSVASEGAIGKARAHGKTGALIDTLVIIGLIGGAGTSLGLGVPLVSAFAANLLGVPDTLWTQLGVLAVWVLLFGTSVWRGLKGGIRILADLNIALAIFIVGFVLLVGPTIFILNLSANSFGLMLDNFFRMSFWLDPVDKGGFPETWTLFYWAWWIAYAPMMGLFFGRISKGRTIRQMVLGILVWGSLGCWAFLAICGGYAVHLDINGILPVSQMLADEGIPNTVVAIVNHMPFGRLMALIFTVLSFVFLATTLDSAAYVLASVSTRHLSGDAEPAKWNRLVWAFALAFIAIGLIMVGGLKTVQASTIITALPLVPVIFILCVSLVKWMKADFGAALTPPVLALEDDENGGHRVRRIEPTP